MKTRFTFAFIGILSMASLSNAATTESAATAASASNAFAVDLYGQLDQKGGNLCISPYSISSALEMTSAGAVGQTASQMLSVLHWTDDSDKLPDAASALMAAVRGDARMQEGSLVQVANSLFGQNGFPYRRDFLILLSKQYDSPLQTVDFSGHPEQAAKEINQWAASQTHDRIKQAVDPSAITPSTRLILINSIYFKAEWAQKFGKAATADAPFFVDGKDSANVPLMRQTHAFNYFGDDSLQVMEMPYLGDYSMLVVLPRAHDGLPALEKSLTADGLSSWIKQMQPQLLQVFFPKFRNEGGFDLKSPLEKLGMTDAFDPDKADFSHLAPVGHLVIDQVVHKTFIQVDEAGTEAAAVTSVNMRVTAMRPAPNPAEPILFRADHPFMYFVLNRSTRTILFMGRVSDPR